MDTMKLEKPLGYLPQKHGPPEDCINKVNSNLHSLPKAQFHTFHTYFFVSNHLPSRSSFFLQELYLWKSRLAAVYGSHWAPTTYVVRPFTADTQLHFLLQLRLLSPWRPCLLLNPPPCSHPNSGTEEEAGGGV